MANPKPIAPFSRLTTTEPLRLADASAAAGQEEGTEELVFGGLLLTAGPLSSANTAEALLSCKHRKQIIYYI